VKSKRIEPRHRHQHSEISIDRRRSDVDLFERVAGGVKAFIRETGDDLAPHQKRRRPR
jgi:hypothetical protein